MSMIPMRMTRRLVRDPKLVAKKYFRMWFWIDFLSCTLKLSPLVVSTLPQYRVCLLPPPHAPHACAIAVGVISAGLPLELSLQKSTGSNNLALVRAFRSPPLPRPCHQSRPRHVFTRCRTRWRAVARAMQVSGLKCIRLLRIRRVWSFLSGKGSRMASLFGIVRLYAFILLLSHWMACLWYSTASREWKDSVGLDGMTITERCGACRPQ
jgi:hypothetical protein